MFYIKNGNATLIGIKQHYDKKIDILIRPILTYNSEIWLMDDYFLSVEQYPDQNRVVLSVIHCHLKINFVMKRYTINFVNIF